jgi:signal transduction histidine kinase/CheY-like chemotaxis protein
MVGLPAASNDSAKPPAGFVTAAEGSRRRVGGAILGVAVGIGSVALLVAALAEPKLAPVLGPLAVLAGAAALWGAAHAEQRRLRADLVRLAAENRRLASRYEAIADAEWQLRDSEQHFRTLAEGRAEVEHALVEARERAEAASQAKSRFLAAVSHEFRTPLNGILGLNDLLLETQLTSDQETYARGVRSSGETLLALIDDLLDFSRIESGRLDLRPEATDLEALCRDIAELLAGRAHAKGIDIAADVDPSLPPVEVDAVRLRQVLVNLAGNGAKFTERGGVTLEAKRAPGGGPGRIRVAFTINDTGPGVPEADRERIFEEFEQVDGATARRHGGAGLGLAISRRIVRRMGGDIAYGDRPGGGAIFRFTLDVRAAGRLEQSQPPDLGGRNLLLLAPDGAEPPVLARILAERGASVRRAATVVEGAALAGAAAAAALGYDAVIMDSRVAPDPGDALVRFRDAAGSRLPAVVLIEPGERGRVEALRAAGFDAYLVRPVRRASLLKIIADALGATRGFGIDPADAAPRHPRSPRRAAQSLHVLLAEDNEISALLSRAVLEGLGHAVTAVRDGASAVSAANEKPGRFAAILMDLHMPGLDGVAAARAIREREAAAGAAGAAIIAVTADVLPETRAAAAAAGIDAILEKPVAPDQLRRVLAEILMP